ncbi:pentatricopeptide repeat-containing protein At4g39530-like [Salvia hispanica]|uniref:pentatricopeptide repeat-containing protein At4g39530-like n=1 Tax=Salvia hispanica TaxID=49212 RepID=UPI00200939E0|nr:pentatricopeptide repeat-containing protein At4g39530-like [Salvia hispanica]
MSLPRLIRLATQNKSICNGKSIHARVIVSGPDPDVQSGNHLLTMYAKLGNIDYAQKLFDGMPVRNLVTWTSLISACSQMGLLEKALNCFREMILEDGITPNHYTYVAALSACAHIRALRNGKEIHARIFKIEETVNSFVNNSLVNFYGKCGLLKSARLVFETISEPNTVSCVSLITSYTQSGDNDEGLRIFLRSLRIGVKINEFTYVSILHACAALLILDVGKQVQALAVKSGVRIDPYVVTCLINLYVKCGDLEHASRALREAEKPSITAWTALIGGCVHLGKSREAIDLFQELISAGLKPSEQTFACVLGAFSRDVEIKGGMQLHCLIIKMGVKPFIFVSNALLDYYAKLGCLCDSFKTFSEMDTCDIVSWNALLAGCINAKSYDIAIRVIQGMLLEGFEPDTYTYSSLLSICGDLPAAEWGKQTHCCIIKPRLDANVVVGSALVDMYAKCGRLNDARKVFDTLPRKNLVSWNAMIGGYAQHGFGREALEIFGIMLRNGVKPDDITYLGVLSSCGHVGATEEALHHFGSMTREFGITPRTDHLACVVGLFARKGKTKEAYDFIRNYGGASNKVVWRSLLSGCVINRHLELARYAAEQILCIDPKDTSAHVMLSNIYADSDMWSEASEVRNLMEEKAMKKEAGYSWT